MADPEDATTRQDGRGDAVIPIDRPDGPRRPTIVYATHGGGQGLVLTAGETVLVDAAGPYEGYTLLVDPDATELQVRTGGDWHIELRSTRLAKPWDGRAEVGRGDQVLLYEGGGGTMQLQYNGQDNFVLLVVAVDGDEPRRVAASIGPFKGAAPIGAGPLLVAIHANNAVWGATATA